MKRIAVLTSGGDAPGMNAALRAVVRAGLYEGFEVFGIRRGYDGLIKGDFLPLTARSVAGIIQHGGTVLKTARCEAFKTPTGLAEAVINLSKKQIDTLVVIGGDGSMAGAMTLSKEGISTVTLPGTIDNDMAGTDYTIGFDTAINTVLEAVNKIRDTAESHDRVAVIEVMGRKSGHIALMAGIACGAEVILVPEKPLPIEEVCKRLESSHARGKRYSIVLVAEGVGKATDIAHQISLRTAFDPHVTVLGYLQRGGSPSAKDNIIASRLGTYAVEMIKTGTMNCLIGMHKDEIVAIPYAETSQHKTRLDFDLYEVARILSQ